MSVSITETKVPPSAAWLGGFGAVPFITLAGAVPLLTGPRRVVAMNALVAYGAVILSFLGGIHWGLAIADTAAPRRDGLPTRLVISVIPSLAGWAALLLAQRAGLLVLAASVAAMLWIDLRATKLGQAPAWYPKLRIPLTVTVIAALLFGAMA